MIPPQPVQVDCPQCHQPFVAHIHSIVDTGSDPEAKDLLLRGRLNMARCPNCDFQGVLSSPILYHDPAKELALVYVPFELNLNRDDQERLIGRMTNALIDSLAPALRKGYLFQPKLVFSAASLIESIMEADGISRETLEKQRKQVDLVSQLVNVAADDGLLTALVEDHKAELTYDFFLTLRAMADDAAEDGDVVHARQLHDLADRLLKLVGKPAGTSPGSLPRAAKADELIQILASADEAALRGIIAANRSLLDYSFFQTLTGQIETAQSTGEVGKADQLTTLRTRVLELTDEIDRETQQILEKAARLLQTILVSPDPRQAIQDHLDDIDEAFLLVLLANVDQARAEGETQAAQVLEGLYGYVVSQLESQMPVEVQLVNRLLHTAGAEDRAALLRAESATAGTATFASLVEAMATDAEEQGQADLANHLWQIAEEAQAARQDVQ